MCRGLVVDKDGVIWARPFPKFFNVAEYEIPEGTPEVQEKIDGSLLIVFNYNDEIVFATRGSFDSDQSRKGREIFFRHFGEAVGVRPGFTHLFEVVYPENAIVVDYGKDEALYFLAAIRNSDGDESLTKEEAKSYAEVGIKIPASFPIAEFRLELLSELETDNSEGVVLLWDNGVRAKLKWENYVKLHKVLSNITPRRIWDLVASGGDIDEILRVAPDEVYKEIFEMVQGLTERKDAIESVARSQVERFKNVERSRAEIARYIQKFTAGLPDGRAIMSTFFQMLDGKDYNKSIWNFLKP